MSKATATKEPSAYTRAKNLAGDRERTKQGTATPERIVKAGEGFEKNIGREGAQRIVSAPLDRCFKNGSIIRSQFEAGDRFRADAYMSAIDPGTGSVDWNRAGGGGRSKLVPSMYQSQQTFDARRRFREIEDFFGGTIVWTVLCNGLVHEHTLEEMGRALFGRAHIREAAVAGHAGFSVALSALAARYANGEKRT